MGATTSSTAAGLYTWGSALVAWNDPIVGSRTWAGASTFAHGLGVTEDVAASDAGSRRSPTKKFASSAAITDAGSRRSPTKRPSSAFGVADAVSEVASFVRKPSEAIGFADQGTRNIGAVRKEVLGIAERRGATVAKRLSETLSATSDSRSWVTFIRQVAESLAVQERAGKATTKRHYSQLDVNDLHSDQIAFNRVVNEALSFAETYQDIINFKLGLSESLAVTDAGNKAVTKRLSDAFGARDAHKLGIALAKASSFAAADLFARRATFYREVDEFVGAFDTPSKTVGKRRFETLTAVGGKVKKANGKNFSRALAFLELSGRSLNFIRRFADALDVNDALKRSVGMKASEAIKLGEELLRGADGVIDEMAVLEAALTVEEFAKLLQQDSPSNYTEFRRLIPGDYEYQEALVRAAVTSQTGDRARIVDLNLQIDVPDVTDRGRATCTSGATTYVPFTRTFMEPPEVSLAVVGGVSGTTLIPRVVGAITTAGFTVGVYTTAGAMADGVVSWNATGY